MSDLISRSEAMDVINKERRLIGDLRETVFDNEDRAHNAGELGCAIRLARKIKNLPAVDAVQVVHDIRKRTSFLRVEDVNKWQSRIILDEGEESKNCAVFYREMDSDLAPVVHARWIDPCINKYGHPCHHCSACGFKASQKDRNFCPNCGARMDGEVPEEEG